MADPSNSSFIPKRGPAKRKNKDSSRQVYIFTLISYVLMFAALLSVGGTYLYGKYMDKRLDQSISDLALAIESFSEADMQNVKEFDLRLSQAYGRLDKSISMVSVFEALEDATIGTVQIISLALNREEDKIFLLDATIETDSFDSTHFQRGIYRDNEAIESVELSNVNASSLGADGELDNNEATSTISQVTFKAELEVSLSSVPYTGTDESTDDQRLIITDPVIEDETTSDFGDSDSSEDNQNDI